RRWRVVRLPRTSVAAPVRSRPRRPFPLAVFPSRIRQSARGAHEMKQLPQTLGALRASPYGVTERARRTVKDEMRQNLLARLCTGGPLFSGVIGYEETVMPQIVNAILSRHNFILLGLRGQAKSRILRSMVSLLDDPMP